jgi:hypothetical protein
MLQSSPSSAIVQGKQQKQMRMTMPKDFEDAPKEPARKKAERRWSNHEIEKRIKEEANKPPPRPSISKIELGGTINNKKPDGRGSLIKAQTKFAKEIRMMMEDHSRRNLVLYFLSIRAQHIRLLKEKLRRLELREAERVAQQKKDLFS